MILHCSYPGKNVSENAGVFFLHNKGWGEKSNRQFLMVVMKETRGFVEDASVDLVHKMISL